MSMFWNQMLNRNNHLTTFGGRRAVRSSNADSGKDFYFLALMLGRLFCYFSAPRPFIGYVLREMVG